MSMTDMDKAASKAVQSLVDLCHGDAQIAGWWTGHDGSPIQDNPLMFPTKAALIVTEIAEAIEGDRKGIMDDKLPHRPMREVELADALIRILDTAGAYGMDLGGAVAEKLAFNRSRVDHKPESRRSVGGKAY